MRKSRISHKLLTKSSRFNALPIAGLFIICFGLVAVIEAHEESGNFTASYEGPHGFYNHRLSLKNDNTYLYSYHGCSQSNGIERGTYTILNETLGTKNSEGKIRIYTISDNLLISLDKIGHTDTLSLVSTH